MNDFTKKELEDIELVYRTFCGDGRILTDLEQTIIIKLGSMVDKYCEHEKIVPNYGPNTECDKCGAIW